MKLIFYLRSKMEYTIENLTYFVAAIFAFCGFLLISIGAKLDRIEDKIEKLLNSK
jgi:hypothetical protein